jgi:hypothetical protein
MPQLPSRNPHKPRRRLHKNRVVKSQRPQKPSLLQPISRLFWAGIDLPLEHSNWLRCEGLGPTRAARRFGYTKQRYFQLLEDFEAHGAPALQSKARGPKTNYRRTEEMVRQIIRHRFLDPDASAEVIAQKLQQARHLISIRSVERVISDFGLQKKTLRLSP